MAKRKPMRERGKVRFSEYFKKLEKGDRVAVKKEQSVENNFPKRIQGRTGVVMSQRGSNYIINLKEMSKEKTFIIHPAHLKLIGKKNEK